MRTIVIVIMLFGLAAGIFDVSADPGRGETAQTFLRRVYAPYVAGVQSTDPTGERASSLFTAALVARFKQDKSSARGEVGKLDADPICACQDFDHLRLVSIKISRGNQNAAVGRVTFLNGSSRSTSTFHMTRERHGWKIADISYEGMPSLLEMLERAD